MLIMPELETRRDFLKQTALFAVGLAGAEGACGAVTAEARASGRTRGARLPPRARQPANGLA